MLVTDYVFLTAIGLLFIANTVIQYRLGFKLGSNGGYSLGVYSAVQYLLKDEIISNSDNTKSVSALELSNYIIAEVDPGDINAKALGKLKMPGE